MYYKIFLTVLFPIFISCLAMGQTKIQIGDQEFVSDVTELCNKDFLFMIVEEMPSYKGGEQQLIMDLNENLDLNKTISGNIVLFYNVNCQGHVCGIQIIKSSLPEWNEKIKQTFGELDNWVAGKQRSKEVDCSMTLRLKIKKGNIKIDK